MKNRPADLLNDLLELARDGERFYRDLAVKAGSPELRGTFRQMAELRQRLMDELAEHIGARGEQPSDRRTVLGASRQLFAEAVAALTLRDDDVYLRQVEAMEDRLLAHYERALEAADSESVRQILRRHLLAVRASHDRMKALKDQSLAA
jgi:uncharacterized protein (TIGR02284 family)